MKSRGSLSQLLFVAAAALVLLVVVDLCCNKEKAMANFSARRKLAVATNLRDPRSVEMKSMQGISDQQIPQQMYPPGGVQDVNQVYSQQGQLAADPREMMSYGNSQQGGGYGAMTSQFANDVPAQVSGNYYSMQQQAPQDGYATMQGQQGGYLQQQLPYDQQAFAAQQPQAQQTTQQLYQQQGYQQQQQPMSTQQDYQQQQLQGPYSGYPNQVAYQQGGYSNELAYQQQQQPQQPQPQQPQPQQQQQQQQQQPGLQQQQQQKQMPIMQQAGSGSLQYSNEMQMMSPSGNDQGTNGQQQQQQIMQQQMVPSQGSTATSQQGSNNMGSQYQQQSGGQGNIPQQQMQQPVSSQQQQQQQQQSQYNQGQSMYQQQQPMMEMQMAPVQQQQNQQGQFGSYNYVSTNGGRLPTMQRQQAGSKYGASGQQMQQQQAQQEQQQQQQQQMPDQSSATQSGSASSGSSGSNYAADINPSFPLDNLDHFEETFAPFSSKTVPFFWHIPKAGGSTVKDVIGSCHRFVMATEWGVTDGHDKDTSVAIVYPKAPGTESADRSPFVNVDTTTVAGIQRAASMGFADSGLADAVVSPFLYEANDLFTNTAKGRLFSVFRHPIDRAVSMFYYLQVATWEPTYSPDLKNWSLEQYATSDRVENNWMVRQLSNTLGGELQTSNLELAKEVIRRKFLVGIMTKLEESMTRFEKYFHWKFHVNPKNQEACRGRLTKGGSNSNSKNKKIKPKKGDKVWELLAAQNTFDIELYEFIEQTYQEQAALFDNVPDDYRMIDSTCCKCDPPTFPPEGFTCPKAVLNKKV